MDRVFVSRRDGWLSVVALAGVGIMIVSGLAIVMAGVILLSLLFFATAGLVLWTWAGTAYRVTDGNILIRSGPFRWAVRIADIDEISPTNNPLSSPAWSLERLRIAHRGKWNGIMVSPEAPEEFLRAVIAADSGLALEDGGKAARRRA